MNDMHGRVWNHVHWNVSRVVTIERIPGVDERIVARILYRHHRRRRHS